MFAPAQDLSTAAMAACVEPMAAVGKSSEAAKTVFQFDLFGAGEVIATALRKVTRKFAMGQLDLFASVYRLGKKGVDKLKAGSALLLVASRKSVTYRFRYGCKFFFEADGHLYSVHFDDLCNALVFRGGVA